MPVAIPLAIVAAGVGGALISSSAAKGATQAQQQMYQQTQANLAPYRQFGGQAMGALDQIYGFGTGGPASPQAWNAFVNTPDYQWALQQGTRALDMSAASKHLLNSGGMVRAAQEFGQGLASQQYGSAVQRLMDMTKIGANAAANAGQTASSFAGGISQGIMGQANPWVSMLNSTPGNALAAYRYGGGNIGSMGSYYNPSSYAPAGSPMNIDPTASFGAPGSAGGIY